LFAGASAPSEAAQRETAGEPVDVTCEGPYEFDFEANVASFQDRVVVIHQVADGADDRLTCNRLEIFFSPRETSQSDEETEAAESAVQTRSVPLAGLTVHRLVATGSPAVLTSPSRSSVARGEHLEYDFQAGQIYLEDHDKVMLRSPHQYVEAVKLRYETAPEGKLGRIWADGPGRFDGALRAEGGRRIQASWRERLRLLPHDGVHVLSLIDGASVHMESSGGFSAEEIHVWLKEIARYKAAADGDTSHANQPETEIVPDRMLALRKVDIDSQRLTGKTERLEAWFRYLGPFALPKVARRSAASVRSMRGSARPVHLRLTSRKQPLTGPPPVWPGSHFSRAVARQTPSGARSSTPPLPAQPRAGFAPRPAAPRGNAPTPRPPASPSYQAGPPPRPTTGGHREKPARKFDLNGKLVRVQLIQRPGAEAEIEGVAIDGDVHFRQLQTEPSSEPPLDVRGEKLRVAGAEQSKAVVRVFGSPAEVSARGMTMTGSNVQLDRGRNRLWIDGAGKMILPPRDVAEGVGARAPVQITWQEGMEFDGQVVRYRRDVRTRMREWNKEGGWTDTSSFGDWLDVTVTKFVDFSQDEQPEDVELRRLVYDGGVFIESFGFDRRGRRTSWDRMQAPNLTVDQLTGEIDSRGGGWIRSVRVGGTPLARSSRQPSPRVRSDNRQPSGKPPQITFTRVVYQQGITGNIHKREIVFGDQVETIYGPVPSWDAELDNNRPDNLGERGVAITCDQLSLYEMGPWVTNRRRAVEMVAKGNAEVEGKTFNARADRLTYAEAKDLVVLEGDGRSNAELWRQTEIGGERSYAAARKILYWRGENRFEVDDGRFFQLGSR
jgi:lipopolysaccharide export system protein LptA